MRPPLESVDVTDSRRSHPPTSVLLPTVRWTDACEEVASQLGEDDELLVVCDTEDDPVAARRSGSAGGKAAELPDGVSVVLAGEPEGCSGKANAIAAGTEAASHDRIVWTDDDFHHPPTWLAELNTDYERRGPTTEVPVFVGRDPLGRLFEPAYVIGGTLAVSRGGLAWGGAVVFERDDLDEAAFLADLRRTVSDDGTLSEHLDVTAADRTRTVAAGGSLRASLERFVRFFQITRHHAPLATAFNVVLSVCLAALCLLAPVAGATLVTALSAATYRAFGIRRATFLLAAPSVIASPVFLAYALARRTFVWGGRRYRWRSLFEVEVEPV
ncbi:glycosyltransferase [Halorubrum sp. AD140]|uniref:glycosyltransferase n=1 Tax=Halorubrum sp. AD140 TaxID=3050073 RepID=UPI002ACC925A|nr:glycosyltransferase [Halorubrum sp. AD140]MDZ5812764.1 glycosyltransferase [Halorubrum sp. AD140]